MRYCIFIVFALMIGCSSEIEVPAVNVIQYTHDVARGACSATESQVQKIRWQIFYGDLNPTRLHVTCADGSKHTFNVRNQSM